MVIAFFPLGSDPGFSGRAFIEFCSIFHSDRILQRPFGICQSRFLLVRDLLGMLPALQNSERAKWGSARADRILKSCVSEKNGISFAGICKSPDVNSCPRFLLFPSAAPVGCDLRDLGSPSLHRNLQKRWQRILNISQKSVGRFSTFGPCPVFSPAQTYSWDLGSAFCARSSIGTRRLVRWLFVAHRALMVCGQ